MFPALVPAVVVPLPTVPVFVRISPAVCNRRLRVHNRRPLIHTWRRVVHDRGRGRRWRFDDNYRPRVIPRNLARRTAAILRGEIVRGTGPTCSRLRCRIIPDLYRAVIEWGGRGMPGDLSTRRSCAMADRKRLPLWRCRSRYAKRLPHACDEPRRPMPVILGGDVARFTHSPGGHTRCSSAVGWCDAAAGRSGRRRRGEFRTGDCGCASRHCCCWRNLSRRRHLWRRQCRSDCAGRLSCAGL